MIQGTVNPTLEYAVAPPHQRIWRLPMAVGVCHLLASVFITWQWLQQLHIHMLHSNVPLDPYEQGVQIVKPVLLFPLVDLWVWCVDSFPEIGQLANVAIIILVFLTNSIVWALMTWLVLKRLRRSPVTLGQTGP